jgi:hypothetical protein
MAVSKRNKHFYLPRNDENSKKLKDVLMVSLQKVKEIKTTNFGSNFYF